MSETRDPTDLDPKDESGAIDNRTLSADLVARANVLFASGASAGRVVPLLSNDSIIGRSPHAHISVKDRAISSRHAQINWNGQKHRLIDLGSTNGTFLNGQRIPANQPMDLTPGDSIQVAETVLLYLSGSEAHHAEHTRPLVRLNPQLPMQSSALQLPRAELLARMLQAADPARPDAKEPGASLEQQIDTILRYVAIVRRHWVPLFASAALCALVSVGMVFARPPPSEAKCRLRITPPVEGNPFQQMADPRQESQFFTTAEQDFHSQALVKRTMTAMQLPITQMELARVLESLKLESVAKGTYEATYKDRSPPFAVKFLSRHVDGYFSSQIDKTLHVMQAEVGFLGERLKENEAELKKTEGEIKEFKDEHFDGLPESAQGHLTTREALLARRGEVAAQYSRSSLELRLAQKRLAEAAPLAAKRVERAAPYETAMVDVQRKLTEAKAKGLEDQHPEVIALQSQLTRLRQLADQAKSNEGTALERDANTGLVELRNRVGDLEVATKANGAELGELDSQLSRVNSIVTTMPEVEAKYAELSRSYAASKDMHAKLSEKLRLSQLQLELELSSAKARYEVLSPPESFGAPIRKALLTRTLIGVAAGLVLGTLIVLFGELRRFLKQMKQRRTAIVPAGPLPGTALERRDPPP